MRNLLTRFSCTLAALVGSLLLPESARATDVPISEEARMHFSAGVALLQDPKAPRYEEAYREFKAAYAASPSYKILGNLGLCAMKIERDGEAINAYETYLNEAGPELTAQLREQIQRDLLTLKAGVVELTVSSSPAGALITDVRTPIEGQDVRNNYGPLLTPLALSLRHGHHVITARMNGYPDVQWEVDATGTTLPPHVFTLVKAPIARTYVHDRPTPVAAYVSGAITLGLAATGSVFGLIALQKHNDFNSLNDGTRVNQATDARNSGQTLNIITDSLFGAAILGAVVTSYVFFSRPTVERPVTGALPTLTPNLDPRNAGATARWAF
jgi:hypothetical protein